MSDDRCIEYDGRDTEMVQESGSIFIILKLVAYLRLLGE